MQKIHSQQSGTGYPLVLVHGFCETSSIWKGLRPLLSDNFQVICPDLPGFGKSPLPDFTFKLRDIAVLLHEWLEGLEISKYVMIGHSLGGYITLEVARKYPGNLKAFGLLNSSAFADSDAKKENRNKLIDFIGREGVKPFIKTFVPSLFYPERIDEFQKEIKEIRLEADKTDPAAVMAYAAAMRDRRSGVEILKKHANKALLIAGEKDQNVPLDASTNMARLLPENHTHILADTAHMSMFEQKEESARIIRQFAQSLISR